MKAMEDHDIPANTEAENISTWDPGEKKRKFRLLIDFVPRIQGAKGYPPQPERKTAVVIGREKAVELKAILQPNPKQMFGPLVQIHAKWAQLLRLSNPTIFQFYNLNVTIEALDVASLQLIRPRYLPRSTSRPDEALARAIELGGSDLQPIDPLGGASLDDAGGTGDGTGDPPGADPNSVSNGPPGLDLARLLGDFPVLSELETGISEDLGEAESGEEDEG